MRNHIVWSTGRRARCGGVVGELLALAGRPALWDASAGLVRPRAARPSGGTQWQGVLVRLWRVTSGGHVDRRPCRCCPEPEQRARTSGPLRDPVRRGLASRLCVPASWSLQAAAPPAGTSPWLSRRLVRPLQAPSPVPRDRQCTYSSPRDGTTSLSVTYTALDSAAAARRHFLAEVDANSDLPLVDLPGVGDRAWLYKRLEGPSHANNQQQTILKANLIIQVATDDSPRKLPAKFDTKMTALGRAIAATAT